MTHPLIFLDIDGVLNAHEFDPEILCGQIHRDKVELLNGVLRKTGARIVLSSAWRYIVHRGEATLAGMEWLFRSHGLLADRLIGITRPDTMLHGPYSGVIAEWPVTNERGRQISEWLATRNDMGRPVLTQCYVVLDDMDLGITASGHRLIQTDGKVGLTAELAQRAAEDLQGGGL